VGGVPKVGGTKKVDVERLLALEPDLVVAVREENARGDVEGISRAGVEVFLGEPGTVAGALAMLRDLARRVEAPLADVALGPAERIHERLRGGTGGTVRVFAPIWMGPLMTVGRDTYAHDVLRLCGGENVFGGRARYPTVAPEEVEAAQPEVVLLPDEPYPFSAPDLAGFYALGVPAARSDRVHLIDGKLLTWYGPRMAGSLVQLAALFGVR